VNDEGFGKLSLTETKKKSSSRMRLATGGEEPSDNQNKFN